MAAPTASMELAQEGAEGPALKPFTPQQAREIILTLHQPAVFTHMVSDWPASRWKVGYLSNILQDDRLRFRIGKKKSGTAPQFETQCNYIDGTLGQFQDWVSGDSSDRSGHFRHYDRSEYWAYADYKYLAVVLKDRAEMLQDVVWADFGFPGRDGQESTIWIGSNGANTPCHMDSYGCNLVVQVEGRKTWHLFSPEDTSCLYPTRIPYEESSVFSKVNVLNPDLSQFPLFARARPHVVTLHPGQVLFVPRHWWHYVESVDEVTVSINSWIELDSDHEARVAEAVTRMIVCAFKSAEGPSGSPDWLNPTEDEVTSHETNLQYLNRAVAVYTELQSNGKEQNDGDSSRERRMDRTAEKTSDQSVQGNSFGPHLLLVLPKAKEAHLAKGEQVNPKTEAMPFSLHTPRNSNNDQVDLGVETCQRSVSSDEVLDCLVDPQVVHMITQLLLQKLTS
ncbi:HSPB1-associated protein 1 [Rhinophrynus dorsalis]